MDKLIVQIEIAEETDFDELISIEEALIQALLGDREAAVDGHDIGEGRFNIFIHLGAGWEPALTKVTATLDDLGLLPSAVVAKFHEQTKEYEVVRPDSYSGTFAL